jgi:hypothetical protein
MYNYSLNCINIHFVILSHVRLVGVVNIEICCKL